MVLATAEGASKQRAPKPLAQRIRYFGGQKSCRKDREHGISRDSSALGQKTVASLVWVREADWPDLRVKKHSVFAFKLRGKTRIYKVGAFRDRSVHKKVNLRICISDHLPQNYGEVVLLSGVRAPVLHVCSFHFLLILHSFQSTCPYHLRVVRAVMPSSCLAPKSVRSVARFSTPIVPSQR